VQGSCHRKVAMAQRNGRQRGTRKGWCAHTRTYINTNIRTNVSARTLNSRERHKKRRESYVIGTCKGTWRDNKSFLSPCLSRKKGTTWKDRVAFNEWMVRIVTCWSSQVVRPSRNSKMQFLYAAIYHDISFKKYLRCIY
jgi:hypothetical protein